MTHRAKDALQIALARQQNVIRLDKVLLEVSPLPACILAKPDTVRGLHQR